MPAPEYLNNLLQPCESLTGEPEELDGDSFYVQIEDSEGQTGKSVFLVMPNRGDIVNPVRIDGDIRLRVRASLGMGRVVVQRAGSALIDLLPLQSNNRHEGVTVTLLQGDVYGYVSTGHDEPFVVRDDSSEPFIPEYESDAPDFKASASVKGFAERLRQK